MDYFRKFTISNFPIVLEKLNFPRVPLEQHYFEWLLYIVMLHILPWKLSGKKLSGKNRYFPAQIFDCFQLFWNINWLVLKIRKYAILRKYKKWKGQTSCVFAFTRTPCWQEASYVYSIPYLLHSDQPSRVWGSVFFSIWCGKCWLVWEPNFSSKPFGWYHFYLTKVFCFN
jgi:hypothetical protein